MNFPYKTLIWATVVVIALLLFKGAWEKFILKVVTVKLFDKVEVTLSEDEYHKVKELEDKYIAQINSLEESSINLNTENQELLRNLKQLEIKAKNCKETVQAIEEVNRRASKIQTNGIRILNDANRLKDQNVISSTLATGIITKSG